ncbi:LOW QUALITY PROTEIN: uncharacterized protein LOC129906620 [Episyrphus balteatus]|uniref:LOW QUALITY PROTEIN: uncharacterized protein LOC129906620 n=1 Tax=Episyrphus balteatus TaxID=286459 RepID=UPI0024857088|nr:LOW QUALITY PROTEIN: uncharacterized protein LOC129906620 [Episyrphus balteatus]
MGIRLVILAVMGLGAMYMMHLLAQDYDRIRRPIKAIQRALRGKRDVMDTYESNEVVDINVNWKGILDQDPLSCLQSLICQIVSGAQSNDTEAETFMEFIKLTYHSAPAAVRSAYAKGLAYRGVTEGCYAEYPFCFYSAKMMLRILRGLHSKERVFLISDCGHQIMHLIVTSASVHYNATDNTVQTKR